VYGLARYYPTLYGTEMETRAIGFFNYFIPSEWPKKAVCHSKQAIYLLKMRMILPFAMRRFEIARFSIKTFRKSTLQTLNYSQGIRCFLVLYTFFRNIYFSI